MSQLSDHLMHGTNGSRQPTVRVDLVPVYGIAPDKAWPVSKEQRHSVDVLCHCWRPSHRIAYDKLEARPSVPYLHDTGVYWRG